jgi:hypothetical protein
MARHFRQDFASIRPRRTPNPTRRRVVHPDAPETRLDRLSVGIQAARLASAALDRPYQSPDHRVTDRERPSLVSLNGHVIVRP